MKELITMWNNTRMIVLTAVTAAVYAAVLIPFKIAIPLVPGFTEVRPANVIPIICSLMFGPAAAWGSAIGNTIGDFFGTLGPGTLFGFVGNFLYGYIPYKMWKAFSKGEPIAGSGRSIALSVIIGAVVSAIVTILYDVYMESSIVYVIIIAIAVFISVFLVLKFLSVRYFLIIFSASAACGLFIGWGVHILGLVPFSALGNIIVLNNLAASAVLGPILLPILYPVIKRMGLLYTDVMDETNLSKTRVLGSALMIIAVLAGIIIGNMIAIGRYDMKILGSGFGQEVTGQMGVGLGVLPFILLMLIAAVLM
jgi:energy-coupling factor transport system substrate-specific component